MKKDRVIGICDRCKKTYALSGVNDDQQEIVVMYPERYKFLMDRIAKLENVVEAAKVSRKYLPIEAISASIDLDNAIYDLDKE